MNMTSRSFSGAKVLRSFDEQLTAPVYQEAVFLIMWESVRSGGSYTALRKSVQGRDRFLRALEFLGVNLDEVKVFEQKKSWLPQPKKNKGGLFK